MSPDQGRGYDIVSAWMVETRNFKLWQIRPEPCLSRQSPWLNLPETPSTQHVPQLHMPQTIYTVADLWMHRSQNRTCSRPLWPLNRERSVRRTHLSVHMLTQLSCPYSELQSRLTALLRFQ